MRLSGTDGRDLLFGTGDVVRRLPLPPDVRAWESRIDGATACVNVAVYAFDADGNVAWRYGRTIPLGATPLEAQATINRCLGRRRRYLETGW